MDEIRDPQYKSHDGSALRIWRDSAKNNFVSEQEGRPIFDDVIYCEVISPGSRDSTPVFELVRNFAEESSHHGTPLYGQKYEEYKDFVKDFEKSEQSDASLSGTPLAQWPEMTRTMVASLKAQNIFTVDALANLPDTRLIAVGPDGRTWREKAKAYIENAKNGAYATELAAQLETAKVENAALADQVKALAATVQALQQGAAGKGSKPGKTPPTATAEPPVTPPPVVDPLAPAVDPLAPAPVATAAAPLV